MSLTSYRAAPPRVNFQRKLAYEIQVLPAIKAAYAALAAIPAGIRKEKISTCVLQTWQRPTLPRLETKYHQRWSVSRPSSEWDRVQPLRHNHQVGETHVIREAVVFPCRPSRWRWAQVMRTIKPIELLVPVSFMRCRTSTPGLSTWSSTTTLREYSFRGGFPA
jgi:hypothetical protein